jgi:hypothetical protein
MGYTCPKPPQTGKVLPTFSVFCAECERQIHAAAKKITGFMQYPE